MGLTQLPAFILFSKLIPANIEASVFAITTGVLNLGNYFLNKMLANLINLFVGVTNENLESLWILYTIGIPFVCLPLTFFCLLPTRKQVEKV